jgi:hypothetical protein
MQMPKEGVTTYITLRDGASSVLSSIGDKTKALDKETQSLAQAYKAMEAANKPLIQRQTELKAELEKSKDAVKDATKAFHDLKDETSELNMKQAIDAQEKLKEELKKVEGQIKENQRTYDSYQDDIRKSSMGSGSSGDSSLSSLSTNLASSGILSTLADAAGTVGSNFLTSALGSTNASIVTDTVSSALSGAAAGAVAGIPGAIIGGLVGAASGLITGESEKFEAQDDAFISYYNDLYDTVTSNAESMVSRGTSLAADRERDLAALTTILGNSDQAASFQQGLVEIGRTPPFSYDTATSLSKEMLGLGLSTDEVTSRIGNLGEAAAALDLSESDVTSIVSTLESSQLAGKLENRVAKSLSKMGINVYEALAESFHIDESEVADRLGDLDVDQAVQAIYDYMGTRFSGAADGLVNTYEGALGIRDSYTEDAEAAGGAGYNTERTKGLQSQIEDMEGGLSEGLEKLNYLEGQYQAFGENLSDQYYDDVMDALLNGNFDSDVLSKDQLDTMQDLHDRFNDAYTIWEESGETDMDAARDAKRIAEDAESYATDWYESSDYYQKDLDSEIDLLKSIRDNTAGSLATMNEYRLEQEKSKGQGATLYGKSISVDGQLTEKGNWWSSQAATTVDDYGGVSGYAYGLDRVPYDDYPAMLHAGERVLTAQEARAQDAQAGQASIQITVSGNSFTGTGEEMADQLAEIIARRLEQAAVAAAPR